MPTIAKEGSYIESSTFISARENIVSSLLEKRGNLIKDPENEYENIHIFIREKTNYLDILLNSKVFDQTTRRCFLAKVGLIKWIIEETIKNDHVGIDQWVGILAILALQVGRLTLDAYNTSDKFAYNVNEEAKTQGKKWREVTDEEDEEGEDQKRQHWLHSVRGHFEWYDQKCGCYQCLELRKFNPLEPEWSFEKDSSGQISADLDLIGPKCETTSLLSNR